MSTILIKNEESATIAAYYAPSANVSVYPCAHRGQNDASKTFDPESRLNTEAKIIAAGNTIQKPNYIVSWNNDLLKCYVGSYYFEIKGLKKTDDRLKIAPNLILVLQEHTTSQITTNILVPFPDGKNSSSVGSVLDTKIDGSTFCFNGLAFVSDSDLKAHSDILIGKTYFGMDVLDETNNYGVDADQISCNYTEQGTKKYTTVAKFLNNMLAAPTLKTEVNNDGVLKYSYTFSNIDTQ